MSFDWIARWAALAPERVAIEEPVRGRALTYGVLDERAARVAVALRAWGRVGPGDRVAVLCSSRSEVFELLFACMKLSAILVPLNWRLAERELAGVIGDCEPAVLIYDTPHAELASRLLDGVRDGRAIALDTSAQHETYDSLLAAAQRSPLGPVPLEAVTTILYTSGTSGAPKGVQITNRQVLFNALNTSLACDLSSADVCLAFLPLFHTGGLHCLASPTLHRGGRVVLYPQFEPEVAVEQLATAGVTTAIAVPTMYHMLRQAGLLERSLPAVRALLCGGAPLPVELLEDYHGAGLPLRQGYGLTEVGPNCFTLAPLQGPHRLGSVGQPAFHSEVRLVDDTGEEVGPEVPGELHLRGPHVTAGYWQNQDATRAALSDDGWFSTGDILTRSEDGYFRVTGRKKEMFISGGENVYPAEVENVLAAHPWVAEVAVKGVTDERWGQVGLAVVVLDQAARDPLDVEALRAWARERLAGYKVPKQWRVVDALPLNASGKVDKGVL